MIGRGQQLVIVLYALLQKVTLAVDKLNLVLYLYDD